MRVLIAEDEKSTRILLKRILEKIGFECIAVESGNIAWEILSQNSAPSISIVNWMMPGITGIELCKKVRAEKREKYPYMIMLTGKTSEEHLVKGLSAGADDYLTKPININKLRARLCTAERIVKQDQTLRDLVKKHSQVLESIPSGLIVTDNNSRIKDWNTQAELLLGIPRDKTLKRKLTELKIDWDWKLVLEGLMQCWDQHETVLIPSLVINSKAKSKMQKVSDVTITPILHEKASLPAVLLVITNVSKQRKLQEQLFLARKLEAVGRLSAGIAHEINTPSQFVKNNLFFLQDSFKKIAPLLDNKNARGEYHFAEQVEMNTRISPLAFSSEDFDCLLEDIPQSISEAINGIDRVTDIVRAISSYMHPGTNNKSTVRIKELINSCLVMTRHVWKPIASIKLECQNMLPEIECYQSELQQVVINLIVNAAHAIGEKEQKEDENTISIETSTEGSYLQIAVKDTGSGINSENLSRIFDPFFTTKEVGKGTGQGLALAHHIIVEKHGGKIDVTSKKGEGTCFKLLLPAY